MISGVSQIRISNFQVPPVESVLQKKADNEANVGPQNRKPQSHIKASTTQLSSEDQAKIQELQSHDTKVRSHEQAHVASGGQYVTGSPTYSFEQGPDGKRYAVGGEVGIDSSPESTPESTIRKMQQDKEEDEPLRNPPPVGDIFDVRA